MDSNEIIIDSIARQNVLQHHMLDSNPQAQHEELMQQGQRDTSNEQVDTNSVRMDFVPAESIPSVRNEHALDSGSCSQAARSIPFVENDQLDSDHQNNVPIASMQATVPSIEQPSQHIKPSGSAGVPLNSAPQQAQSSTTMTENIVAQPLDSLEARRLRAREVMREVDEAEIDPEVRRLFFTSIRSAVLRN